MRILLLTLTLLGLLWGQQEYADPEPSILEPRQVLVEVNGDAHHVASVISNLNNGPDKVTMKVVVYGPALKTLQKSDKEARPRWEALMMYNVEVIACENTMDTYKLTPDDLIGDLSFVRAGLVEVIERKMMGWTHIKP